MPPKTAKARVSRHGIPIRLQARRASWTRGSAAAGSLVATRSASSRQAAAVEILVSLSPMRKVYRRRGKTRKLSPRLPRSSADDHDSGTASRAYRRPHVHGESSDFLAATRRDCPVRASSLPVGRFLSTVYRYLSGVRRPSTLHRGPYGCTSGSPPEASLPSALRGLDRPPR